MCVRGATLGPTPGIHFLVSVGSHVVVSLQWILVNYNDKLDPMEVATFLFAKYEKQISHDSGKEIYLLLTVFLSVFLSFVISSRSMPQHISLIFYRENERIIVYMAKTNTTNATKTSISVDAHDIFYFRDPDVINFKANFGLEIENLEVRNLVLQERPLYDRIKLKKRMHSKCT